MARHTRLTLAAIAAVALLFGAAIDLGFISTIRCYRATGAEGVSPLRGHLDPLPVQQKSPTTYMTSLSAMAVAAVAAFGAVKLINLSGKRPSVLRARFAGTGSLAATTACLGLLAARCSSLKACSAAVMPEGATDPSLFVQTNVKLGDKKKEFMKACSKAVAQSLGKPESYVAVCVQDGQDIIWGGSDDPCALCKVFSLGSINLENNKALTVEVTNLLSEFNVPANRIYVNFFDLPRENVGYNGATFAG
eukprot:TRINITY_DN83038_c0_g1_i1.p1 TRINITY_DN83038_c0_g1~~TRINITY_DN83038_c0_g1_i1.p1  ORF type:complete len:249 (+),score=55.54 TRINITY_DN83038_c0_g1_i1:61-807(+)